MTQQYCAVNSGKPHELLPQSVKPILGTLNLHPGVFVHLLHCSDPIILHSQHAKGRTPRGKGILQILMFANGIAKPKPFFEVTGPFKESIPRIIWPKDSNDSSMA